MPLFRRFITMFLFCEFPIYIFVISIFIYENVLLTVACRTMDWPIRMTGWHEKESRRKKERKNGMNKGEIMDTK